MERNLNIFFNNVQSILQSLGISNSSDAAKFLSVNSSTYRGWISFNRTPSLSSIDSIADKFCIETYLLFKKNMDYSKVNKKKKITNDSRAIFIENLDRFLTERGKNSWAEKESIIYGIVGKETLKSYYRKNNYITPSMKTICNICSYIGVPVEKIIKKEKGNVENNS